MIKVFGFQTYIILKKPYNFENLFLNLYHLHPPVSTFSSLMSSTGAQRAFASCSVSRSSISPFQWDSDSEKYHQYRIGFARAQKRTFVGSSVRPTSPFPFSQQFFKDKIVPKASAFKTMREDNLKTFMGHCQLPPM